MAKKTIKAELTVEIEGFSESATRQLERVMFDGMYRALARFYEPVDETEIEKVHRLRTDGWEWKDIVKQIDPDIDESFIDSEADRLRKQYCRAYQKD